MTNVSRDDVVKLAALSNLQLEESEVDGLTEDIKNILGYIEQLNELDTAGIEPTYQVTDLENISRAEEIAKNDVTREELLALAPEQAEDQIKVPKVL